MYLAYMLSVMVSATFGILSFCLYGRTHQKYNGPDGISGLGEATKFKLTKKCIPGLWLTILTGFISLKASLLAYTIYFTHFKDSEIKNYTPILICFFLFVLLEVIKSSTELLKASKQ